MTKYLIGAGIAILLVLGLGSQYLFATQDPDIISRRGLHWHPELEIYVKGESVEIPQNIGLGAVHKPMHTHDDLPIIHLEFEGLVKKEDLKLEKFFENWGNDMRGFGTELTMTVNGTVNTEYENYILQDGDKVELRYE